MTYESKNPLDTEYSFSAEVKLAGINPYVDVPVRAVTKLWGAKAAVLVKVARMDEDFEPSSKTRLDKDADRLQAIGRLSRDGWFRTTLVSLPSEPTRLYLDTWMRESARVEVGDQVHVRLKRDHTSRELSVPPELRSELDANPDAEAAWEKLAPSRRREILTYLNFLKTPAALQRNVQKVIAELCEQERS